MLFRKADTTRTRASVSGGMDAVPVATTGPHGVVAAAGEPDAFLDLLRESDIGRRITSEANARTTAQRRALIEQAEEIEANRLVDGERLREAARAAEQRVVDLTTQLMAAQREHAKACSAALGNASIDRREPIMAELIASAHPCLAAFIAEAQAALDPNLRHRVPHVGNTGATIEDRNRMVAALAARRIALTGAIEQARSMMLEADQSDMPARVAALREAIGPEPAEIKVMKGIA